MKCENCELMANMKKNNGTTTITCGRNGSFSVSDDFEKDFRCDYYTVKAEPEKTGTLLLRTGNTIQITGIEDRGDDIWAYYHTPNGTATVRTSEIVAEIW